MNDDMNMGNGMGNPAPAPQPASTVQPMRPVQSVPQMQPAPQAPQVPLPQKNGARPVLILVAVLVLALIGIVGFLLVRQSGLFAVAGYTENNFFSGILAKSKDIDSSSYSLSGSLSIGDREKDAQPFAVHVTNTGQIREQYQNDAKRGQDIQTILNTLAGMGPHPRYASGSKSTPYPASLKALRDASLKNVNKYYQGLSIVDPVTGKEYQYQVTDGGNNFLLQATFENRGAINQIKKGYGYTATSTPINGMQVGFTKDSNTYFYLATEPPKPLLVELGDEMRYLPAEVSVLVGVSASSEWKGEDMANWKFNFNGEGSFGDLTYKINADALKKDSDYYFRVNNLPSLFLGELSGLKGKWIKVGQVATSTKANDYSGLSEFSTALPEMEKEYKENRIKAQKVMQKAAEIADEVKLISFKTPPTKEKVDGRNLTRYDLVIRKEAILPFYNKLADAVTKDPDLKDYGWFVDEGMVEYLQSPEFQDVYDFYTKNTSFVFYTDSAGFPALIEEKLRIVPPDTATQLAGKQVNILVKLVLTDINSSIKIEAPAGATPLEQVIQDFKKNSYGYDAGGEAKIKGNLSSLRAQAELTYSDSKNSYGKNPFKLGACAQTAGTLFGNTEVFNLINMATNNVPAQARCASTGTTGNVSAWAVSVPLPDSAGYSWCVDSMGNSKQITGVLSGAVCK